MGSTYIFLWVPPVAKLEFYITEVIAHWGPCSHLMYFEEVIFYSNSKIIEGLANFIALMDACSSTPGSHLDLSSHRIAC